MLELAYGQFSSLSPIAVWKMAPLFEGTPLISELFLYITVLLIVFLLSVFLVGM